MTKSVLKKSEIGALEPDIRTHFLNENAVRFCKSLGDLVGISGLGVHHIELPPRKDSTAYHFHHQEDECVYILSGRVELELGGKVQALGAGDFVGHPARGAPHIMKNTSDSSATYLVIGQRLEEDIVDYPILKKRLYLSGDSSELVDIDPTDT